MSDNMKWNGKERRKTTYESTEMVVVAVLKNLGFNMDEPLEIQADIRHLRRSREICKQIQSVAITTGIGIVITALIGAIGYGTVVLLHKNTQETKTIFNSSAVMD